MLFFSSDNTEVEQVSREFIQAGIPCEVRNQTKRQNRNPCLECELWIRDDRDCHRAFLLCVQRNIGFARRPAPVFEEELQLDYQAPDRWTSS
jgi:hypothetical protein